MQIIAIEEHFSTPLLNSYAKSPAGRVALIEEVSQQLGWSIDEALADVGSMRIAEMDRAGIDMQLVSLTVPGAQAFAGDQGIEVARDANDIAAKLVADHPKRFAALAAVPTNTLQAAVNEIERTKALGFRGLMINGPGEGRFLDDQSYWDIFACAEANDLPIYLHPATPARQIMDRYYEGIFDCLARAPWGFAAETGLYYLRLMFAGVFDAFPQLQIVLGHMGEGIPYHLERIDAYARGAGKRLGLKLTPKEYVAQNLFITTSANFSVPAFRCASEVLGVDRILFAVDYPYAANVDGVSFLQSLPVSDEQRAMIAGANTRRLFGF